MKKIFIIKELSSSLYLGEEKLVPNINDALEFDNIELAEDILETEVDETGFYEILPMYYIDAEQRKEDEEYDELESHINKMISGIQYGMRIQNGEGTNWVGYFKYNLEFKESIKWWFNHNKIDFPHLKKDKYYKVTGWNDSIEEVSLDYISKHIKQYTLETKKEWLSTKLILK